MQHSCKAAKLWRTNPEPWTVQMLSLSHMLSEVNGFLKLLSAKDITFSLANISFFIHPFIHYAFTEVGTCALVTAGIRGQLMESTKLVLSSTLFLRWNLNYQAWRQSTLTHLTGPQNLFLTRFCLYFDFGDYKYSGEWMRSLVWRQALQDLRQDVKGSKLWSQDVLELRGLLWGLLMCTLPEITWTHPHLGAGCCLNIMENLGPQQNGENYPCESLE